MNAAGLATRPWFTYGLMALLVLVFACELAFGINASRGSAPSLQTLIVMGGQFGNAMRSFDQWWRLFTAPFLHADALHLAFNCLALWLAGRLLEHLVGWRWFAAMFATSALAGALASLLFNPPSIVAVGASGGIVGLFAAAIVASFHFEKGGQRWRLQWGALQVLVPSLLPLLSGAGGLQVDYAAHFGGAVGGGLLMLLIQSFWPVGRRNPKGGTIALVLATAFAGIAALSLPHIVSARNELAGAPFWKFYSNHYQEAADGFAQMATKPGAPAAYLHLWRYFAMQRGGLPGVQQGLVEAAAQADPGQWPSPLFQLFLETQSPEAVMTTVAGRELRCEAWFYIGMWRLQNREEESARQDFKAALSTCPASFVEFDGARQELQRLE